jgi:hypothetical protein
MYVLYNFRKKQSNICKKGTVIKTAPFFSAYKLAIFAYMRPCRTNDNEKDE